MASGEDLGAVEDTCAEAAGDRCNIPLPRFDSLVTLGDMSDYECGEEELRVQEYIVYGESVCEDVRHMSTRIPMYREIRCDIWRYL